MTPSDLGRAVAAGDAGALPADELAAWVSAQRWFSSKQRDVAEFNVLDLIVLREADPVVAIVIAEARFGAGTHELYQVPIAVRPRSDGWDAGVISATSMHVAYDALVDEAVHAALAARFGDATAIDRPSGCVRFHWDGALAAPPERPAMRAIDAEQSNTSVVLDERLVLKVFRRIEPGINPELEMLRFLAAHEFTNIATLAGWYSYTGRADGRHAGDHAALRSRRARRLGARPRLARGRRTGRSSTDSASWARSPGACTPSSPRITATPTSLPRSRPRRACRC